MKGQSNPDNPHMSTYSIPQTIIHYYIHLCLIILSSSHYKSLVHSVSLCKVLYVSHCICILFLSILRLFPWISLFASALICYCLFVYDPCLLHLWITLFNKYCIWILNLCGSVRAVRDTHDPSEIILIFP